MRLQGSGRARIRTMVTLLCFWRRAGLNELLEMYMTTFKCLPGNTGGGKLIPQGTGASKAPWYWANEGHQNVKAMSEVDYDRSFAPWARSGA
jgi:hypothetical protein